MDGYSPSSYCCRYRKFFLLFCMVFGRVIIDLDAIVVTFSELSTWYMF